MHPDPYEGDKNNEDQHERRAEFYGVNKRKVATSQTAAANPEPASPIGKIDKNEGGNCCNHNGGKNNSEKKQAK